MRINSPDFFKNLFSSLKPILTCNLPSLSLSLKPFLSFNLPFVSLEPFLSFICLFLSPKPLPSDLEDIPRLDVVVRRPVRSLAPRGLQDFVSSHFVEREEGAEDAEATVEHQHAQVRPGIPSDRGRHVAVAVEEEFPQATVAVLLGCLRLRRGFGSGVRMLLSRAGVGVRGLGTGLPLPPPLAASLASHQAGVF